MLPREPPGQVFNAWLRAVLRPRAMSWSGRSKRSALPGIVGCRPSLAARPSPRSWASGPISRSTTSSPCPSSHRVRLGVRREVDRQRQLVNNVGAVRLRVDGFLATTDADFDASLQLNFFAAVRATRAAVADMLPRGEGTIVNVAPVDAFFHPDGLVIDYGAAKAALLNVAKALSQEPGPKGFRINSVSPGPVSTDLWLGDEGVAATLGDAAGVDAAVVRERAVAGIAPGRFSTPEEVATLVAVLASPRTANVTGSKYVIDGGLVKTM